MKALLWREWADAFPGLDLAAHPLVVQVARVLSRDRGFMEFLGHSHPIQMTLEPICLIAVAALCRVRNRWGAWDVSPVVVPVKPQRFDETVGVPGLFNAIWEAGLVTETREKAFTLGAPAGSFPKGFSQTIETNKRKAREAELAAVREKIVLGMTPPDRLPTHPESRG